jgi:hypothetical protein
VSFTTSSAFENAWTTYPTLLKNHLVINCVAPSSSTSRMVFVIGGVGDFTKCSQNLRPPISIFHCPRPCVLKCFFGAVQSLIFPILCSCGEVVYSQLGQSLTSTGHGKTNSMVVVPIEAGGVQGCNVLASGAWAWVNSHNQLMLMDLLQKTRDKPSIGKTSRRACWCRVRRIRSTHWWSGLVSTKCCSRCSDPMRPEAGKNFLGQPGTQRA